MSRTTLIKASRDETNSVIASTPMWEAWVINKRNGNCSFTEHQFDLAGITETFWEESAWLECIKEVSAHNLFGKGRDDLWWHYPYKPRVVGRTSSSARTLPCADSSGADGRRGIKLFSTKHKVNPFQGATQVIHPDISKASPQDCKPYLRKAVQNWPQVSLKLPPAELCQHSPLSRQRNMRSKLNWKPAFATVQAIKLIF